MKNKEIIDNYEKKWVRPTISVLVLIGIPLIYFTLRYGVDMIKASNEYNASINEAWTATRRDDTDTYFKTTPNEKHDTIIKSRNDIPDEPVLINFYIQNCIYCETSYPVIQEYYEKLRQEYGNNHKYVAYVEMNTPIGQELTEEYEIQYASSLLLYNPDSDETFTLTGASSDQTGKVEPDEENIDTMFNRLELQIQNHEVIDER